MIGKIFGIMSVVSVVFSLFTSRIRELGTAVIDGASAAVGLTISLCGMMCLWCGIMRVLEHSGMIRRISLLLSPFLRCFFPDAYRKREGCDEIAANVSANLLGIGNAATPLAICAMEKLQKNNPHPDTASHDMITLAVLNTASISIVPSTILALRRAAGSTDPFAVVVPIWICSLCTSSFALILCRAMRGMSYERKGNNVRRGNG